MENFDIVVFGIQPWDIEIGSNCKNIAATFARSNRVLYVNQPLDRKSKFTGRHTEKVRKRVAILKGEQKEIEQIDDTFWVLNPKTLIESTNWLPRGPLFSFWNKINSRRLAKRIGIALSELGFKDYILFNDSSMFLGLHLKTLLSPRIYIYYMRDYLTKNPFWRKHGLKLEPKMIALADVVVNNSVLYAEYTDSIRTVDNKHIIFIEGNWFANDFTGLTPPWDDNMVYSPHKYWSKNETADIQWVLTIRDQYNVPIYFGESGENSNPWFTDAIRLFEEEGLGWAWWPMKKVESISCPLSVIKTPEYEYLLNYWNGNGPKPSAPFAKATLMELAENFKLENCVFQKDVIDAMFRQVNSTESIPYRVQDIPGVVFASDFSMGNNGYAYFDLDAYDYHVTTGNFTAWNSGWAYRNDAVDIQEIDDNVNSNGLGVGWMSNQEWMQYDIKVEETAVYDLNIRYASNGTDGKFHLEKDGLAISPIKSIPNSGGWENWETTTLSNLVMTADMETFILAVDEQGFNLSSIEFIKKSGLEDIATTYLMAETLNKEAVRLILNKPMVDELPDNPAGFSIKVNNVSIEITELILNPENNRAIDMKVNYNFKSTDQIRISYTGDQIKSVDNIPLSNFTNLNVNNGIENYHPVPGKIEAEDYHFQLGVQLENCSDDGGGKNIGYLDQGDYLDYFIDVHGSGTYDVTYRTAAESAIGKVELQLINDDGSSSLLHSLVFSPTGGWQNWRFTTKSVELPKGKHKIRLVIVNPQFNMNWFEFNFVTPVEDLSSIEGLKVFPNPGSGRFHLNGQLQESDHFYFSLISMEGRLIDQWEIKNSTRIDEIIDISALRNGKYNLQVKNSSGKSKTLELLKLRE